MNSKIKSFARNTLAVAAFVAVVGCSTPKDVAYFQDVNETVIPIETNTGEIKIEPLDKLSIVVKSQNPEFSSLFNLSINTDRTGSSMTPDGMSAYTVNSKGDIDFPLLGELHVAGMTRSELAGYIKGLLSKDMVKDAVVTVEFLNTGFSVLGSVNRPGRFEFNRDRLTILQALSMAGDLSIQGQRENVLVMREESDGVHTYRIDLTKMQDVAKSPAYYLQQGDIVYVEPNEVAKRQSTVNGNNLLSWGFWVSVASLVSSVAILIAK